MAIPTFGFRKTEALACILMVVAGAAGLLLVLTGSSDWILSAFGGNGLLRTLVSLRHCDDPLAQGRLRMIWSLSNAFSSAFKELDPIPQFKATARLGEFLESRFSRSF